MMLSLKHVLAALAAFTSIAASAQTYPTLPRESRVPGGIALIPVAPGDGPAPVVTRESKRVWVAKAKGTFVEGAAYKKQQPKTKGKNTKQKSADETAAATPASDQWVAVVGIPLTQPAGEQSINMKRAGSTSTISYTVAPKKYTIQKLTIPDNRKVDPLPVDVERIATERAHLGKVLHTWTESQTTDASFTIPAQGRLSSRFGLQRVLNGKPRNPHAGLDVAVPAGTPIYAAANGVVNDTGDYFFNGQTVFVNHGNGLLSMYIHLSEIKVNAGDVVKQGQLLGLSGMTGRVTGPHLHWSVLLNSVMVEPELFLKPEVLAQ